MASWKADRVGSRLSMEGASGRRASSDWGNERPPARSAISMSSRFALSDPPAQTTERTREARRRRPGWRPSTFRSRSPPMACIQATFPRMVAISPLWASDQKGWARRQAVVVFVE